MITEQNQFNPDWDVMAVMLEEQQRMAKRIEELEAQQCKYPTCQSEEYQQLLVSQIKRELIAEQEPIAWTLLLVGEHNGLVGKAGEKFVGHPEYYERVDVYKSPPAQHRPVPQFTTSVRKMWSGSEVQRWINENWNKIPD